MRIRISRFATVSLVLINFILLLISWKFFLSSEKSLQKVSSSPQIAEINLAVTTKVSKQNRLHELKKYLQKSLTVILRDFYHFDNDLKSSIDHLLNFLPDLKILVISDQTPYPPISIFRQLQLANQTHDAFNTLIYGDNVQFISTNLDITKKASQNNPLSYIQTKYVLFLPDNFKLSNARHLFQRLIKSIEDEYHVKKNPRNILVIPFKSNQKIINYCFELNIDVPLWTLEYSVSNKTVIDCDLYTQKHAMLMESFLLHDFLEPFLSPFPEYFYLQAKLADIKLKYSNETLSEGGKKLLMSSYHSRTKRKTLKTEQFKALYKRLQIKKVVKRYHFIPEEKTASLKNLKKNRNKGNKQRNNNDKNTKGNLSFKNGKVGNAIDVLIEQFDIPSSILSNYSAQVQIKTDISYFGCEKNTKSCIGQVYNEKPFYLYINRKTPPCCLEKLKSIFQYVIEELENTGVRYWLDNAALKNAVDLNDLSTDAFEIDISFNINDYNRSTSIKRCYDSRPFSDLAGFYWIKATDGHYLKVQFSKTNDIHVNLLPFEISGDRMTPKGFYGRKAKSFSIEYIHPMSSVTFLGKTVFVPNNVRNYLNEKGWN